MSEIVLLENSVPVISAADMQALENELEQDKIITKNELMDAAGNLVADRFCEWYPQCYCRHVLVLCGSGNNGGDGFVIADRLVKAGYSVSVVLPCGEPKPGTLADRKLKKLCNDWKGKDSYALVPTLKEAFDGFWNSESLDNTTHVIDAVFGIGYHGQLPATVQRVFSRLKVLLPVVVAVDIPSGMEADGHRADAHMLPADRTVTFTAPKPAHVLSDAKARCGEIYVASIGVPEANVQPYLQTVTDMTSAAVADSLVPRDAYGHKGTFSSLLSVCGCKGMAGAALMAGKAALRSGIGLLHMALPESIYPIAAGSLWEAVYHPLPETSEGVIDPTAESTLMKLQSKSQAVLVGCGLSEDPQVQQLLASWLPKVNLPLILDADGLKFLATHKMVMKDRSAPLIMTPHPGEAACLLGITTKEVEADRIRAARRLATEYCAVAVLKGAGTLIACPDGDTVYINRTGCSGMATGGSGDVLAGMLAALVAGGMTPLAAAKAAVHLHGLAGEKTAEQFGNAAMLPTDMIERLPMVLSQFEW